jgi:hypothetical protein
LRINSLNLQPGLWIQLGSIIFFYQFFNLNIKKKKKLGVQIRGPSGPMCMGIKKKQIRRVGLPTIRAPKSIFIFLFFLKGQTTCHPLYFFLIKKSSNNASFAFCRIQWRLLEKRGLGFFCLETYFQHLENTLSILINLSITSKNLKIAQKSKINLNPKTFMRPNLPPRARRRKKTPRWN